MINIVLLTGFLGVGKTTLMQELLNSFEDRKIAVIVNEFGSINIDAVILRKDGIEVAELSNGSVFCACIKDRFVDSLVEMSKLDIEYLFIEASGLSDPSNMPSILKGISHATNNIYAYKGSICILDAERFIDLFDLLPAIEAQLKFSNEVVLNKIDLANADKREKEIEIIASINPIANIHETSYCRLDIKKIIENMEHLPEEELPGKESLNTIENRATSVTIKAEEAVPAESLRKFIEYIACDCYRIKGFVHTDKGNIEISAVGENVSLNVWNKEINQGEVVVISSVGIKIVSKITEGIEKYLKGYLFHL